MEISVSPFSNLDYSLRIDAEYYQSNFIEEERKILKQPHVMLGSVGKFVAGPFGSAFNVENYDLSSPYRYIRGKDVKQFVINCEDNVYIPLADFNRLKKYAIEVNDILISVVGTIGNAAIVEKNIVPAIFSCKSTVFRATSIAPLYIITYLNCKYGRSQLIRSTRGTVQTGVNMQDLKSLIIYKPSPQFELIIQNSVIQLQQLEENIQATYSAAQRSLLLQLALVSWKAPSHKCFFQNSSTVLDTGRFDAEYYHPKYDELFSLLQQNAQYCRRVKDIAAFNGRGVSPEYEDNGKLRFINSQHILEQGLDYDGFDRTNEVNWKRQSKARVYKNDILTYSTGANVGRTATYLEDDPALAGIDVNILRLKEENPIYVGFVMNSMIGRMQTRRQVTGSAQAHLYASDIDQFLIPFVDPATQDEIVQNVLKAHEAKKTARALLDAAKRAVEMAIEEDEVVAEAWLRGEAERLGVKL